MTSKPDLHVLSPSWPVATQVRVFATTRLGGVSQPPYDALNLGLHVGDDRSAVLENRRHMKRFLALPGEPYWLNQTHGTTVCQVGSAANTTIDADGAYTCQSNRVLAVLSADCLPVVLSDVKGTQVAVVHAGWRGLAAGILSNALRYFKSGSEVHAWLGPAIGPERFEVGEDVREAFMQRDLHSESAFRQGDSAGKYWADLYALATEELLQGGCTGVTGAEYCTHKQSHWFHSHRRDGSASGRMATLVWIDSQRDA